MNWSKFYEWLFRPEKFSGLSRNGPLKRQKHIIKLRTYIIYCLDEMSVTKNPLQRPRVRVFGHKQNWFSSTRYLHITDMVI